MLYIFKAGRDVCTVCPLDPDLVFLGLIQHRAITDPTIHNVRVPITSPYSSKR